MAAPMDRERERRVPGFLGPTRARKGVVLLAAALVPLAALVTATRQAATYEATARVFLGQAAVPGDVGTQLHSNFKAPQRAVKTQAELAHSPVVAAAVLKAVPAKGDSARRLLDDSTIAPETGGDVLAFSVRDGNPRLAQRLANAYAQ